MQISLKKQSNYSYELQNYVPNQTALSLQSYIKKKSTKNQVAPYFMNDSEELNELGRKPGRCDGKIMQALYWE